MDPENTTTGSANDYLSTGSAGTDASTAQVAVTATAQYNWENSPYVEFVEVRQNSKTKGLNPVLYFKYVKRKFKLLEGRRLENRLKKIERAFYTAVEAGQDALAEKFVEQIAREMRESTLYAKGIKRFIEKEDLDRHRHSIRDGHISDTLLKNYTRAIPKKVLERKKQFEGLFDDFVIYHYYSEAQKDLKDMDREEKEKMKDPVLFGIIRETNRLYFIADWEDEYCDLTFDELAEVIGGEEKLTAQPEL